MLQKIAKFHGPSCVASVMFVPYHFLWMYTIKQNVDIWQQHRTDFENHILCEALPQNREQVTFWVKWVFGIIVRRTLSALIWYQNQVRTSSTFWDVTICVWDLKRFLWKYHFEKSAFIPIVLDVTGCRKWKKNFVGKCLKISQKLHVVTEDILRYVKKQKSQNR